MVEMKVEEVFGLEELVREFSEGDAGGGGETGSDAARNERRETGKREGRR